MSTAKRLIREWMDLIAIGPAEAWIGKVAPDVVVRLPYAPPGVVPEMHSFDAARDILSHHWRSKQSFAWHDVVIRETEDSELFLTIARSEAVMTSGERYSNSYIMLTRVRDTEYFNPLPIIELLRPTG
jgi:ketosteroid isomerase-like protein